MSCVSSTGTVNCLPFTGCVTHPLSCAAPCCALPWFLCRLLFVCVLLSGLQGYFLVHTCLAGGLGHKLLSFHVVCFQVWVCSKAVHTREWGCQWASWLSPRSEECLAGGLGSCCSQCWLTCPGFTPCCQRRCIDMRGGFSVRPKVWGVSISVSIL